MKRSFYLFLAIVAVSAFGLSSLSFAGSKDKDKPKQNAAAAAAPKISKEEAKRAVLFANTGSTVEGCRLVQGKDHTNWAVNVVKAGTQAAVEVEVDGVTGKILNATSAGSTSVPK
jgi:uncharacterized membrane protein YkoI